MSLGGSKGKHDEGCHVCGGFPGSLQTSVSTLYQCTKCGFFTCNRHTSMDNLQRVCPNCRSKSLKVSMSESGVKRAKKGGLPGGAKTGRDATKGAAQQQLAAADKKKKGYTPLGGGGGRGMFGGKGIFGSGDGDGKPDESPKAKFKDKHNKDGIDVSYDKDGNLEIKSIQKDEKGDGKGVSFKINIKGGAKEGIHVSVTDDNLEGDQHRLTGDFYRTDKKEGGHQRQIESHAPVPTGLGDELDVRTLQSMREKMLEKELEKERRKRAAELAPAVEEINIHLHTGESDKAKSAEEHNSSSPDKNNDIHINLNQKSNEDKQNSQIKGKGRDLGIKVHQHGKESVGARNAGGGQKVSLEKGNDINIDVENYAPTKMGVERHGKSSHMTIAVGLGDEMTARTDLKGGGKGTTPAPKGGKKTGGGGSSDDDGDKFVIKVGRRGDDGGESPEEESSSGLSQEPIKEYIGTHNVGDIQGTVELSEIDIDKILDAVLEDEELALMLIESIKDDHLKQMAIAYIEEAGQIDDEDDEEEEDSPDKMVAEIEGREALELSKKKSKLLREFAKSLQPKKLAVNYSTDQVFAELKKTLDVYEEHPNEETKPKWLNPTLADACFNPSIEGLSSMQSRFDASYSLDSKGDKKTVPVVQVDLGTVAKDRYLSLLNEKSLILGAIAFGPRSVGKFDEETLIEAAEDMPGIVAIGPVGLDNHFSPQTIEKQKEVFKAQIRIAQDLHLPVFVFSDKADNELITIFKELDFITVPVIYASPINKPEILELCQERDMYILLRSEITFESYKETYPEYIKEIPPERWLLASGSEFSVPQGKKDAYKPGGSNPLIPEVAPEKNRAGHILEMDTSSFIGGNQEKKKSIAEAAAQNSESSWNTPEQIRATRKFLVEHLKKQHTHQFYKQLLENFMYVFSGEAAKDILASIDEEALRLAEEERRAKEESERKVLIIKAEE